MIYRAPYSQVGIEAQTAENRRALGRKSITPPPRHSHLTYRAANDVTDWERSGWVVSSSVVGRVASGQ